MLNLIHKHTPYSSSGDVTEYSQLPPHPFLIFQIAHTWFLSMTPRILAPPSRDASEGGDQGEMGRGSRHLAKWDILSSFVIAQLQLYFMIS